jgi:hypothetical protein
MAKASSVSVMREITAGGNSVPELLNAEKLSIDPNWALRVPANLALRRSMLPFALQNNKVLVACADPTDRAGKPK